MEIPNFICNILSSEKREEQNNKKNVKVINEFLKKRKKLQTDKDAELAHLEQLLKNRSIDKATYDRLKNVMILTQEQKRIDLIRSIMEKSVGNGKSVSSQDNQPLEDDQPLESDAENN